MSILSKIKDAIKLYDKFEASFPLELDLKSTIRVGGTGMAINHGDWVNSNAPGNLYSNWGGNVFFGGTRLDYASKVGALYHNSAYLACIAAYQDAFSQAPVCLKEKKGKDKTLVEYETAGPDLRRLMDMLDLVNDVDDSVTLLDATLIDYIGKGNAYWRITPDSLGNPARLDYLPESKVKPVTAQMLGRPLIPGQPAILYYEYFPTAAAERVEREELVHIRMGKNPEAPHMGFGRGDVLLREIFADNEATNYSGSILYQMGVAQRILQPKMYRQGDIDMIAPFNGEQINTMLAQASTGDNRGRSVAIESLFDIHESDSTPEKMALDVIRRYPESRVAAVTRVPAKVAGLLIGEATSTFANYEEARESFWQDTVLPNMRRIRAQVTRQLIWRNKRYEARRIWFGFNYDEVPALQVDEQARDKNIRENFKYQLIDAEEARSQMGLDPKPEDTGRMYTVVSSKPGDEEDEEEKTLAKMINPLARITEEYRLLTEREDSLNGHHEESLSTVE